MKNITIMKNITTIENTTIRKKSMKNRNRNHRSYYLRLVIRSYKQNKK